MLPFSVAGEGRHAAVELSEAGHGVGLAGGATAQVKSSQATVVAAWGRRDDRFTALIFMNNARGQDTLERSVNLAIWTSVFGSC